MLYNAETDTWCTTTETIDAIRKQRGCTKSEALAHIDYSIKHGILYDSEGYMEHFAPYEN